MSASPTPAPLVDADSFLSTLEGEVSFFRSLMRARPVGIHRTFHILTMRNAIYRDTKIYVSCDAILGKLRELYNLDALEALVRPSNHSLCTALH
jgi:MRG-binding protein